MPTNSTWRAEMSSSTVTLFLRECTRRTVEERGKKGKKRKRKKKKKRNATPMALARRGIQPTLKQGGNLLKDLNLVDRSPALNWLKKRESLLQKRRMSGMPNNTMASLSRPSPKAQAFDPAFSLASRIACCITLSAIPTPTVILCTITTEQRMLCSSSALCPHSCCLVSASLQTVQHRSQPTLVREFPFMAHIRRLARDRHDPGSNNYSTCTYVTPPWDLIN